MEKSKQYRSKLLVKNTILSKDYKKMTIKIFKGMEKQITFVKIDGKYVFMSADVGTNIIRDNKPTIKDILQIIWLLIKPTKIVERKVRII